METNKVSGRIHPLVATAAVSVTLVSLAGVAAITGLLPSSHSSDAPVVAPLASAPAATATPTTANALVPNVSAPAASATVTGDAKTTADAADASEKTAKTPAHHSTHIAQTHHTQPHTTYSSGSNSNAVAQASICGTCGRIEAIEPVQHQAKPSGLGVAAGAVLGGVLGNQVGNGNGRTLATIAGAVGGGYAGNEVEKRTHTTTTYQVRVRMEDGSVRNIPYSTQPGWNAGDRVRVVNGTLEARG
jgi:outer membrane lipoprotein SlyB